jgi:mono/diheme cytochrome c family protein
MSPQRALAALGVVVAALVALVYALNVRDEARTRADLPFAPTAEQVRSGGYLALAGDCVACHTARGGAPYAGGRAIDTPFGRVYSTNLTPDPHTGLGSWSSDDFWRALHNGRSKDGRLLYPAFPYPSFTQVSRTDADAMFAYLRTLPAVEQPNRAHELRFPYDNAVALAIWRALFFRPGVFEPDAGRTAEWNRGAYLVRGLGHCDACHAGRNVLGAVSHSLELGGALIPAQNWYAPPLAAGSAGGVADWHPADLIELLRSGISRSGSVMGPMAEVVYRSTQHIEDADLRAIATYLASLRRPAAPPRAAGSRSEATMTRGARIYGDHCADCHGREGEGAFPAYPPLAGNRTVVADPPSNPIHAVVNGGYAPATRANPRPYGMPPFVHVLSEAQIADVLTYIRGAWGNDAPAVTPFDVQRYR